MLNAFIKADIKVTKYQKNFSGNKNLIKDVASKLNSREAIITFIIERNDKFSRFFFSLSSFALLLNSSMGLHSISGMTKQRQTPSIKLMDPTTKNGKVKPPTVYKNDPSAGPIMLRGNIS